MDGFLSGWFVNAPLLLGMLGAAIPFILHLVYRRRAPKIPFSTLRFLRVSVERTARRRRIRDWLLLLLRSAVIFLLALALAGPIFRSAGLGGEGDVAAVLVIDNTWSMAAAWEETTQYARACSEAVRILGDLPGESQAAVVFATAPPEENPGDEMLTTDRNGLADRIARSEVSAAPGDLAAAISRAEAILSDAPNDRREIYLFTDLQQSEWRTLDPSEAKPEPALIVVNCNAGETANLTVADLAFPGVRPAVGVPVIFRAGVINRDDRPHACAAVLYLNRAPESEQTLQAPADGETEIVFSHVFDAPGVYTGWVEIEADDVLALDNRRYFAIEVPERIRVGLVREEEAALPTLDEAFFLTPALNPGGRGASPIAPEPILREELTSRDLDEFHLLVLLDLPSLNAEELRAISARVSAGGSLILFPGDRFDPAAWNALTTADEDGFARLLSIRFGGVQSARPESGVISLEEIERDHPVFRPFSGLPSGFFRSVAIQQYHQLVVPEGSAARVLASLNNGDPFLIERPGGESGGAIYCFAVDATTRWSNLPARTLFLPLMHQLTYAAAQSGTPTGEVEPGRIVRWPIAAAEAENSVIEVTGPRGIVRAATVERREGEQTASAYFRETRRPGVTLWREPARADRRGAFVVNLPPEQGDLTPIEEETLRETMLAGRQAHFAADAEQALRTARRLREGLRLRTPILFFVVALFLAECLFANLMGGGREAEPVRVTGAGAAVQQAAS